MNRLRTALFSVNTLRKAIGLRAFYKATKENFHIVLNPTIEHNRILILAPHPDDDIFGVGGLIAKLASQEKEVIVIYFCNGIAGTKTGEINKELAQQRKKEAYEAANILGIKSQRFLDIEDGKLQATSELVKKFEALISEFQPDIIFLPSFLDNHPDHRAVNEILVKSNISNREVWAYEVWTPIFPNRIIEINNAIEKKKAAIEAQESQLDSRGYEKAILGLNQYRAEINGLDGYAEAYFACSLDVYKRLF